jgi:hypothetical protein
MERCNHRPIAQRHLNAEVILAAFQARELNAVQGIYRAPLQQALKEMALS